MPRQEPNRKTATHPGDATRLGITDSERFPAAAEGSRGRSTRPDNPAITATYAKLPRTEGRDRVLRDLMRPSTLKSGGVLSIRSGDEREEALKEIIGLQADRLAEIVEEGVQLRGPLVLSFAERSIFTDRLKTSLTGIGRPMIPVEIKDPWQERADALAVLRDAGCVPESESGAPDGLAVLEALERHHPHLLEEIRVAHDRLWHTARIVGLHSGALDHLLLLMTNEFLADWAAGGLAAVFAHPFFFAVRPRQRRRLIQKHRPRLVIHDELAAEELRAIEAFAPTRLLLSQEAPA